MSIDESGSGPIGSGRNNITIIHYDYNTSTSEKHKISIKPTSFGGDAT
jgi:hypothetical protein